MTFESNKFDMGSVMNKLRAIAEESPEKLNELAPEDEGNTGKEIEQDTFSRTMMRLQAIKDAVGEDHYNALRSGVRSLYMNRRPNLQQMTALMDLLETVLAYVAEDNALFQRLKTDLSKDKTTGEPAGDTSAFPSGEGPKTKQAPEVGAPGTAEPQPEPEMRGLKT
jgi:hypothetical protein